MKIFSIIEPPSTEAIKLFAERNNLSLPLSGVYHHPQEDYLAVSMEPPILVVADGVTLNYKKLINNGAEYPNPSPAGNVARIFCERVRESARRDYESFSEEAIEKIFREGNKAVAEYNYNVGKSEISGNITGYYSATGAFVIVKDNRAYWATICDSYFAHFDNEMNLKFMSSGVCSPYAVINGEERMSEYLERGVAELKSEDRITIFTDGFAEHMKNVKFQKLFKSWDAGLGERVEKTSHELNAENPEKYGHERSIIAVLI